jgi:hypothetical protein
MKKIIRVSIVGALIIFLMNSRCIKIEDPDATGLCYIDCRCGTCGQEMRAYNNTKQDCETWFNVQKTLYGCSCGCTHTWTKD